jgi:hypothetical protein
MLIGSSASVQATWTSKRKEKQRKNKKRKQQQRDTNHIQEGIGHGPNLRARLGLSSGRAVEEVCEVPKGAASHGTRTCFPLATLCKLGYEQK